MDIEDIPQIVDAAIAKGLNLTATTLLQDIRRNAPFRTGRLIQGYRVTRPATPNDLNFTIGTQVPYADKYYPATPNTGRRPKLSQDRPRLFAAPGADQLREQMAHDTVQKTVQTALQAEG